MSGPRRRHPLPPRLRTETVPQQTDEATDGDGGWVEHISKIAKTIVIWRRCPTLKICILVFVCGSCRLRSAMSALPREVPLAPVLRLTENERKGKTRSLCAPEVVRGAFTRSGTSHGDSIDTRRRRGLVI